METPKLKLSFKQMLSRLKFGGGGNMSADFLWQLILGSAVIGVAIIMTFAYFTYDWAKTIDIAPAPAQKARDTLSLTELQGVIAEYKNKEAEYGQLLRTPPRAPSFRKGRVTMVTPSTVSSSTPTQSSTSTSPR